MSETYIHNCQQSGDALVFFLYIANNFTRTVDQGIAGIPTRTGVAGAALEGVLFIWFIQACQERKIATRKLFD